MKRPVLLPLQKFVPALVPRYDQPTHLKPVTDLFERIADGEEVHATVSAPPRHGKTEVLLIAIAWLLKRKPKLRIGFVGYADDFAGRKSWRALQYAKRAKVPLDRTFAQRSYWRTGVGDGGVLAAGVNGQIVGEGFDLLLCDDLIKDRVSAESSLSRERLHETFTDVLLTRLEPGGSAIVCGHRWHVDDIIGHLVSEGSEEVKLAALNKDGEALFPKRFTAEALRKKREQIGEYAWASLYQQEPRPRGGVVFNDIRFYEQLPDADKLSYVIGCDLAYTAKTRADYSTAVVCAVGPGGEFYVVHVERKQCVAPDFAVTLSALQRTYRGAQLASYVAGTERGSLDFMARSGLRIKALTAREDKFSRAQFTAAAWNAGRILVPKEAKETKWLNAFVEELAGFTGVNDRHDDQVDALVSAFDARTRPKGAAMLSALRTLDNAKLNRMAHTFGVSLADARDFPELRRLVR